MHPRATSRRKRSGSDEGHGLGRGVPPWRRTITTLSLQSEDGKGDPSNPQVGRPAGALRRDAAEVDLLSELPARGRACGHTESAISAAV